MAAIPHVLDPDRPSLRSGSSHSYRFAGVLTWASAAPTTAASTPPAISPHATEPVTFHARPTQAKARPNAIAVAANTARTLSMPPR